jgi:hypothetical protein
MVPARALETKVDRNEDDLDEARRLVLSRTRALGLNLTTVSNGIGRSPGYIHQYIWRKIPQRLLQPEREKVAKMLGVDEKLLRGPGAPPEFVLPPGIETGLIYKEPIMPSLSNAGSASRITGRDVVVHSDTGPRDRGGTQNYVPRPGQAAVPGETYAIWISSNRGRLRPGDLAYVDCERPPRVGDMAVVSRDRSIVAVGEIVAMTNATAQVQVDGTDRYDVDRSMEQLEKIRWVELA